MGRRREIERWLAVRKREGLTFRELAERSGICPGTLGHWAWRLRCEARRGQGRRAGFVELLAAPPVRLDQATRVEIVLGNERRVIVDARIEGAALSRVLSAVERC